MLCENWAKIMIKWISICVAPLCLSIVWYFPFLWSLVYLLFLSLFIVIAVFVLTLWGHVSLSSPHQTSLFLLDKVEKDVRQIEETLKVWHVSLIKKWQDSITIIFIFVFVCVGGSVELASCYKKVSFACYIWAHRGQPVAAIDRLCPARLCESMVEGVVS